MSYTVDVAVSDALKHLERVSSHLRKHDQQNAANQIGRLSVLIVEAVEEGMVHIALGENVIDVVNNNGGHVAAKTNLSAARDIQQQAVVALMNEVKKEQKEPASSENHALQKLPAPIESAVQPGSWAQVARSVTPGPSGETAQFMSPVSMTSCSGSNADRNTNEHQPNGELVPLPPAASSDIPEEKAGVVRIYGRISRDAIRHITTRIHEGPLQDIRVESNARTRVIFQNLSSALAFMKSDKEMQAMFGYGRIGPGYRAELAEIVDWNDDFRLMNQPMRERRRLSFARRRIFADGMTPEKWRHDIHNLAGPGNIDFLWVFNSGNATAVFTSTIVARKVLETFNKWKDYRPCYLGISVTYSSDPCEKEITLLKENNRPSYSKYHQARRAIR